MEKRVTKVPIGDRSYARNVRARKILEAQVKRAVYVKYPSLRPGGRIAKNV